MYIYTHLYTYTYGIFFCILVSIYLNLKKKNDILLLNYKLDDLS